MDYHQKMSSLKTISPDASVTIAAREKWVATAPGVQVWDRNDKTAATGFGRTPVEAIEDLWSRLTDLGFAQHVVAKAYSNSPIHLRWADGMWQPVQA